MFLLAEGATPSDILILGSTRANQTSKHGRTSGFMDRTNICPGPRTNPVSLCRRLGLRLAPTTYHHSLSPCHNLLKKSCSSQGHFFLAQKRTSLRVRAHKETLCEGCVTKMSFLGCPTSIKITLRTQRHAQHPERCIWCGSDPWTSTHCARALSVSAESRSILGGLYSSPEGCHNFPKSLLPRILCPSPPTLL